MNIFNKKSHPMKKFFLIIFFIPFLLLNNKLYSEVNNQVVSPEYIKKIPKNNFYILGPGDQIKIEINEDTSSINSTVTINGEGVVNLKRLKRIYISGLTINELTDILNKEYKSFVNDPDVTITIIKYRPVKVFVDGAVKESGFYVLSGAKGEPSLTNVSDENLYFPTLFDALRTSGGVNINADLSKIKVIRSNSISNGSGKITTTLDLIKTFDLEDNSQNIRILDGDTIFVPEADEPILSQINKAIKSNLNPRFIKVLIAGRVGQPGILEMNKTSYLYQALDRALTNPIRGRVILYRYTDDGKSEKRIVKYKPKKFRPGDFNNPYLKDGDLIVVRSNLFSKTTAGFSELTEPLVPLLRVYSIYRIINPR